MGSTTKYYRYNDYLQCKKGSQYSRNYFLHCSLHQFLHYPELRFYCKLLKINRPLWILVTNTLVKLIDRKMLKYDMRIMARIPFWWTQLCVSAFRKEPPFALAKVAEMGQRLALFPLHSFTFSTYLQFISSRQASLAFATLG